MKSTMCQYQAHGGDLELTADKYIHLKGMCAFSSDIMTIPASKVYCKLQDGTEEQIMRFNGETGVSVPELHICDIKGYGNSTTSIDKWGVHTNDVFLDEQNKSLTKTLNDIYKKINELSYVSNMLWKSCPSQSRAAVVARMAADAVKHLIVTTTPSPIQTDS